MLIDSPIKEPPSTLWQTVRSIGPGLIITANIVGTGELILTTKLGADVGFTLLWFIVLGCFIKVFVQVEWGRVTICSGATSLDTLNSLPGPRARMSWAVWLWALMYLGTLCQMTGMVTTIASLFTTPDHVWAHRAWALATTGSCVALLLVGRYALVQWSSTLMVVSFTICTVIAASALQWTRFAISPAEIGGGLAFRIPPGQFLTAFGAFAVTGVGAAEIIFYPIWCLEKGYASFVGPRDDSPEWTARAQGWMRVMRVDAWLSMIIYTLATAAFYLLGAAILHRQQLFVTNQTLVINLSKIYEETFGAWGVWVFITGAFMTLYSTLFVSLASNSRLFADVTGILGIFRTRASAEHRRITRFAIVGIAVFMLTLYLTWGEPVYLVTVGAVAQGIMLPFLGWAAVSFRRRVPPALRPGAVWTIFLWLSFASMAAVGLYLAGKNVRLWS